VCLTNDEFEGSMKVDDFHNSGHPALLMDGPQVQSHSPINNHDDEPAFSDDEDDVPLGKQCFLPINEFFI
jgi:hypothetical protein